MCPGSEVSYSCEARVRGRYIDCRGARVDDWDGYEGCKIKKRLDSLGLASYMRSYDQGTFGFYEGKGYMFCGWKERNRFRN
jgi:hypothetical protein